MPQPAPPVRSSAAPETFWTKVDGHRIFALRRRRECSASSEHPPLILVHGLGVSGKYMIPTAAALAARYDVYVPDLPGFGKSSKPRSTLDVREHANVLAAWMSAIGCERAVLIGNSFGCQVIADLALRFPQRAERLVLIGPTIDPAGATMREQARRFLMILPYERWSQAGEVVRDYWSCGTARYLQTLRLALRDHIEAKLPHIQTPTLVVRGEHDALAPQPWAEQVTRLLPNARLAVVPGAAHAVNYSAPSQLATLIEGFLEDTRGAPAG